MSSGTRGSGRIPRWFHQSVRCGSVLREVGEVLREEKLNTVCEGARCPNRGECFSSGTATFMIMGDRCTRDCRFCAVPAGMTDALDPAEPEAVARAASKLRLEHVVVTSVTRDDLEDGGARHFADTIESLRSYVPLATVEVLVPDFRGDEESIDTVIESGPDILNHNVETVERLYPEVRPGADYERSLGLLSRARERGLMTKSGFMVGLGESLPEIERMLADLRERGCRMITAGQYLKPDSRSLSVERYYSPEDFRNLKEKALALGFEGVAAGPLVRSSYRAKELYSGAREENTVSR